MNRIRKNLIKTARKRKKIEVKGEIERMKKK